MSIEQSLERIAVSLEKQTKLWVLAEERQVREIDHPLVVKSPEPTDLSEEKTIEPRADILIHEGNVDPVAPTRATELWDPMNFPVQKTYKSKEKQQAIIARCAELGIKCPASWTYPKRHQAILSHTYADPTPAVPEVAPEEPPPPMLWEGFKAIFMAEVDRVGTDAAKDIVEGVTGQRNVNPEKCEGHYKEIISCLAHTDSEVKTPPPVMEDDLLSDAQVALQEVEEYTPGDVALSDLLDKAQHLTQNKVTVAEIQAAIKHIASGVTAVPEAKRTEAMACLLALEKGKA
jgi:hypothetical protein